MGRILVIDDDADTCALLARQLAAPGRVIETVTSADAALARLAASFDVVLCDINLGAGVTGLDVLKAVRANHPATPVILISGESSLETAVDAVRAGAFDYLSKPWNAAQVRDLVGRAIGRAAAADRADTSRAPVVEGLVGRTPEMLEVYKQIAHAADTSAPVLVVGESGTGKELVALAIHSHGPRARAPFVPVNCGAIAETLLEAEFFGHVRGAFTGAVADRKGVFEQANSGTIFLDEIGEMAPALQVRLLRVLQDGEVRPVGAQRALAVNARVIAATNVDIVAAVEQRRFREDLYYRLSVITIRMPPLRDRAADIPLLARVFLSKACARTGRSVRLHDDVLALMAAHSWPGNVRELENTIERLVLTNRFGVIEEPDFRVALRRPAAERSIVSDLPTLDELERRYLVHVLRLVEGNRSRAAEVLGIDRRSVYRMAARLGVPLDDSPPDAE